MLTRDIVVVGGGPAGASCAFAAARAGLDVVLLEKESLPRRKLCAGGLTQKSIMFLKSRDLLRQGIATSDCREIRTEFGNRQVLSVTSKDPIVSVVDRSAFDKSLTERAADAGAEVSTLESFRMLHFGAPIRVSTSKREIAARFVIGADGVNSAVARSAGMWKQWPTDKVALGLQSEVPSNGHEPGVIQVWPGKYHGYIWIFPRDQTLHVGIVGPKSKQSTLMGLLRRFMTYRGYVSPLRGWHLPIAGEGQKPKVASRSVLLAGDASGAVDPWFEEGIYYALRTGEMAATACLEENAVGAYMSAYRGLWADLKWASRFAKTFYEHESFMPYFFERNRGELEKLLVDLLSGRLCYKEMYMRVSLKFPKSALAFSLKRILNTPSIGSTS